MVRLAVWLSLLLVVLSAVACAAPAPIPVPRAVNSPTLDGRLDDWPAAPLLAMADAANWYSSTNADYVGPEDISAEARLLWDNTNLYVAVKVRDDKLVRVPSAGEIDKLGDSLVLGLASEDGKATNEFALALLASGSPRVFRTEPASAAGEVGSVNCLINPRADEGGGWQVVYEFYLPWSELTGLRPFAGERLKFTLAVADDDGAGIKGFMEQSVPVELVAETSPVAGQTSLPTTPRRGLPAAFLAPDTIRFDSRHFFLHKQEAVFFGGEIDYTQLPKSRWADRLRRAKDAGMNLVSVTVPWSYHQRTPEKPNLDALQAFLGEVAKAGLWAQVNLGPYAGESQPCGGLPVWYLRLDSAGRQRAADQWMTALLGALKGLQLTAGGPVVAIVGRPVPEPGGWTGAASLAHLMQEMQSGGIRLPVLTANAVAARDNNRQSLANLLDTISFYQAPTLPQLSSAVLDLAQAENGPPVVSALPGRYGTRDEARHSADAVRAAFACGAALVTVSDFAPGDDALRVLRPGETPTPGVLDASDIPGAGYGELSLLGHFFSLFGPQLARTVPVEGALRTDDPKVKASLRLTDKTGFVFLWSDQGAGPRQVRLSYNEPGTTTVQSIPAAGAISLPAEGAKILPLDVPVGRGTMRYSTSEVAALHAVGDRTLLVVYGDPDTPGEIALQWPGPPLVFGEVLRQDWDPSHKVLTLDYYHKAQDQYVLVDDLQIAILSRDRALAAAQVGDPAAVTLSAGVQVAEAAATADSLQAALYTPAGQIHLTAALPSQPSGVTLDGQRLPFTYAAPARVLELDVKTSSFETERRPSTVWQKIGRGVLGGPPKWYATFDRAQFSPDRDAPKASWTEIGALGRAPEAVGASIGQLVRFRTHLDPAGRTTLALHGALDPVAVTVNGKPVRFATEDPDREADISALLGSGENEIALLVYLLPRASGLQGLHGPEKLLPEIVLKGEAGDLKPDQWEMAPGLAGEAAGFADPKLMTPAWSIVRLGPWRDLGKRFADLSGAGWYRLPFALPRPDGWRVPCELHLTIAGNAQLFLNGVKLATLLGSGSYSVPLPTPPLAQGGDNLLAIAVYDPAGQAGLLKLELMSDEARMAKKRQLEVAY